MRKLTQVLIAGALSIMPLAILTGCGLQCHGCEGMIVGILGNTKSNIKHTNCAGPGAIFRCGLNTVCWPTECVSIELSLIHI